MRMIDADALVWKIMALCRSYQKTHLVHAEMLEHFTNSVLAYIDHAEEHKTEVKVIQYDVNLSTEPCKSTDQNVADVPSGDLISRADAIEAVMAEGRNVHASEYANAERIIHEADAVEALSMLPSADRPKGDPETEPAPVVAYICDRRRCAICSGPDGGCDHTTDIKHAAHFKNVAGQYFERPYMEEEEDE